MNRYLKAKRDQYESLRASIDGIQERAVDADRDLTEDELRSVNEQAEQARKLADEIESLTDVENRNRKVAELSGALADVETRATGNAATHDRDPGHYTRASAHSFFGDLYRSRIGDEGAQRRLHEHTRALDTGTAGAGVVPPHWLTDEFETIARQGRRVAAAVRQVPLGNDPRPLTLPKQTAGTDSVVGAQSSENSAPSSTDAWASSTTTVTPKPIAGIQIVSRQMLDMANPAIDQLIFMDMLGAYNADVESQVVSAMVTAAGTAVKAYATEAAWTTALDPSTQTVPDDLIDLALAVRNARKLPADILALSVSRYGDLLKLKDGNGRPLMPMDSAGPMNVIGTGSVAVDGRIHGLGVLATDGIDSGTYPESIVAARASDTLLFESNVLRFNYQEVLGPESVKLGVWGYVGVHVKHSGESTKRNEITASA